jgi:hypothetical protein
LSSLPVSAQGLTAGVTATWAAGRYKKGKTR